MGADKKNIVIIGAGGHAKAILSALDSDYKNQIIGYTDIKENDFFSTQFKYLGNDEEFINTHLPESVNLILGLSYSGNKVNLNLRKNIIRYFTNNDYKFLKVISSNAYISEKIQIGEGAFIAPGVKAISNAIISEYCSINTGAIIEHDVILKRNVQVSSGAIICGGVSIGENSFIGAGSVVRDDIYVASNTIIGMGSVVLKDIKEPGIYFGNPLKRV